jgi:DegV family protein with EDD domain
MSGSYNSACNAKDIVMDEYPQAKITVIDSAVITGLQGLYVMEAVRMRDDGLSYEESIEQLQRIKETGRIVFTTADISYLKSGGRLGKLISIANNALKIKPLILFKEGEIFPTGVVRARKKSYDKLVEQTKKHFRESGENPDDYNFSVGFGYDKEEGEMFRDYILEDMKTYSNIKSLDTFQIGATIAVHTGPHPLGIVFMKRYDR